MLLFVFSIALCTPLDSDAAETGPDLETTSSQTHRVEFIGVDGEIKDNIARSVRLVSRLNSDEYVSDGERRRLQGRVVGEALKAVEPFGYYRAKVTRVFTAPKRVLRYNVELNEPVTIRSLTIEVNEGQTDIAPEFLDWVQRFPLKQGEQLQQPAYEAAKKELQAIALRLGYFDANYVKSEIHITQERLNADITLRFQSGPRYTVNGIEFDWRFDQADDTKTRRLIEGDVLDALISVKDGSAYDLDALGQTQRNLAATPYFARVDVQPGELNVGAKTVPVIVALTPRKRKSYSVEAGAGTDTGGRGGVGYENRRINRQGHNLSARLGASEIRRSANFNYRIPIARKATDSLDFFATLEEERGDVRDFRNTAFGSQLALQWRDSFLTFGVTASRETSLQRIDELSLVEQTTDLLMPSIQWQSTKTDNPHFPTKGWAASAIVRGASQSTGSDVDLAQAIINANALYPFGAGRFKLRIKLAGSVIDSDQVLPESLGFLAGGDDSVRGYRFESIGVQNNGEIDVARNLLVGSLEYQHPIVNDIALAAFFDMGDAFDSDIDYKRGAGLGLRWRLPFGALRLDFASALDLDGQPIRVHFGFGTDL